MLSCENYYFLIFKHKNKKLDKYSDKEKKIIIKDEKD